MAEVSFKVRADTAKATSGMSAFKRKTVSAFDKISSKGSAAFSKLKTLGSSTFRKLGIAASALTVTLGVMIKTTADSADKIGKLSTRLGMSAEALSQYKFIAGQTGIEFTTLTTAFQRLTRRISEATKGTGVAKGALEELNLSASALNLLAPERQFEAITKAMGGVERQSDKVRLAMQLFDTEGVSLLQTMAGGTEAINKMKKEITDLGGVFSQVQAREAEAFNDSIDRLGQFAIGTKNTIANLLIPSITKIATSMTETMKRLRAEGAIDKWAGRVAIGTINAFSAIIQFSTNIPVAWNAAMSAIVRTTSTALNFIIKLTKRVSGAFFLMETSIELAFAGITIAINTPISQLAKLEALLNKIPLRKGTLDLIGLGEVFGDVTSNIKAMGDEFIISASKSLSLSNGLSVVESSAFKAAKSLSADLRLMGDAYDQAGIKAAEWKEKTMAAIAGIKLESIGNPITKIVEADTSKAIAQVDNFVNSVPKEIPVEIVITTRKGSAFEKVGGTGSAIGQSGDELSGAAKLLARHPSSLGGTRSALDINSLGRGDANDVFSLTQKIADLKIQAAALGTFGTRWAGGFNPDPTAQAQLKATESNIKMFQSLLAKTKNKAFQSGGGGANAQSVTNMGGVTIIVNGETNPQEIAIAVRKELERISSIT